MLANRWVLAVADVSTVDQDSPIFAYYNEVFQHSERGMYQRYARDRGQANTTGGLNG